MKIIIIVFSLFFYVSLCLSQVVLPAFHGFYTQSVEFTDCGTVTDIEGNIYQTVVIGSQCWMAENLKYLPSVAAASSGSSSTPYYYVYGYNGTNVETAKSTINFEIYAVLYNWPAVMDGAGSSDSNPSGVQGICPDGWHLPSDAEWKELEINLGMTLAEADATGWRGTTQGSKMAKSYDYWTNGELENDTDFNTSGFSALPGGRRRSNATWIGINDFGAWWSTSTGGTGTAYIRALSYNLTTVNRDAYTYNNGFSVRCVKD
jgi:uncharacterized protein (TIGR02145 family)